MDQVFNRSKYNQYDEGTYVRDNVFIIMPFGSDFDSIYSVIKEECQKLDLIATRIDEDYESSMIISDITTRIEEAEFIICDLSLEKPNVYYELGYAHGVGNQSSDILLIAHQETKLHFDIAPLRVMFYSSLDELHKIIREGMKRLLGINR